MPKIKTSELTGAALDWAVAKCEGFDAYLRASGLYARGFKHQNPHAVPKIAYSTDWTQGGPIIERERIPTEWSSLWNCWTARDLRNAAFSFTGPTPLIAAMRSYVASKLGDGVNVPDELLP